MSHPDAKPKRSLGQNFLVDPNYQRKIIDELKRGYADETILEIGPGRGALTQHVETFAKRIVLVEKDRELAAWHTSEHEGDAKWTVVNEDFLKWDFSELRDETTRVLGNLPYNVSTQILIGLLKRMGQFSKLVLMFQKEVAMRCLAKPGSKDFGPLAIWCQLFAKPTKLCDVPGTAFRPRPRVMSSVLSFEPSDVCYDDKQQRFIDFVHVLFNQRRKKIRGNLKAGGFDVSKHADHPMLDQRAEQLSISEIQELFGLLGR